MKKKNRIIERIKDWWAIIFPIGGFLLLLLNAIYSIDQHSCGGYDHPEDCDPDGESIADQHHPDD